MAVAAAVDAAAAPDAGHRGSSCSSKGGGVDVGSGNKDSNGNVNGDGDSGGNDDSNNSGGCGELSFW